MRWITQMPSMGKHTVYTAVYSWKRGRRCPYASQTSLLQDDGSNLMCLYAWLMSLPFPRFVYTHVKRTAHTHTLTIETAFRLAACANIQCLTCMRPQARFGMAAVTQHTDTHTHRRANTCGTYASTTISYFCSDGGVAISRTSPSSWIAYETCAATATDGLGDESSSAIGWSTERRYPTRVVFGLNFQLLHRRKKKTQWFSGFVLVLWNNWVFEWFNFFLPCCAIAALLICFCYLGMFILLLWTRCVAHFSSFFFCIHFSCLAGVADSTYRVYIRVGTADCRNTYTFCLFSTPARFARFVFSRRRIYPFSRRCWICGMCGNVSSWF